MEDRDSRFAKVAVGMGLATPAQIEEAVRVSNSSTPPKAIGQTLVERGVLTLDQMFTVLREIDSQTGSRPGTRPGTAPGSGSGSAGFMGGLNPAALLGQQFGRYTIIEELGRGGMGVVFKAKDVELGRVVALKILRDAPGGSATLLKRFQREAQMASKLRHPNIVSVHDVGTFMGAHYFTMDSIEGTPLDHLLARGTLSIPQAVAILEEVARAVHYAHRNRIIHRDLKPGNIVVDGSNRPYVMDFGLAKSLEAETRVTRTGQVLGTPLYMAPEQVRGNLKEIAAASDVYSLGVILYELLTGRPPYQGKLAMEIYRKILDTDPVPPRKVRPGIPIDIETICLKAIAKESLRRYATAEAFAEDLARFRRGEAIFARPSTAWEKFTRRLMRRKTPLAIGGAAVLGAVALAIALSVSFGGPRPDPKRSRDIEVAVAQAAELVNRAMIKAYTADPDVGGPTGDAIRILDDLLKKYPDAYQAHYQRGRALLLRVNPDEAEKALSESIRLFATAPAHYQRGRIHVQRYMEVTLNGTLSPTGRKLLDPKIEAWKRQALEDFRQAVRLGAMEDEKALAEAFQALLEERPADAVEACTRLLSGTEKHDEVYLLRGWCLSLTNRQEEAERDFDEILKRKPSYHDAYVARSNVRFAQRRHEDAVADLDRALELRPGVPENLSARGRLKAYLKRFDEAIRDAQEAVDRRPDFLSWNALGAVLMYAGRPKEAADAFTQAMDTIPEELRGTATDLLTNRGWARSQSGDVDGAIDDYTRALENNPNDPNAHSNLADLQQAAGRYEDALKGYTRAIERRSHFGPTYYFRAGVYARLSRTSEMLEDLESAIAKTPPDPRYDHFFVGACLLRGQYRFRGGDFEEALGDFSRALERTPDHLEALAWRGRTHHRLTQWAEGVKDLKRLFELKPDGPSDLRKMLEEARDRLEGE